MPLPGEIESAQSISWKFIRAISKGMISRIKFRAYFQHGLNLFHAAQRGMQDTANTGDRFRVIVSGSFLINSHGHKVAFNPSGFRIARVITLREQLSSPRGRAIR